MSWPKECKRFVDWSYYQTKNILNQPIDVDLFCQEHPEVDGAVVRFVWPSGMKDPKYDHYYDGFMDNEKMVMGYGWPNPTKNVAGVVTDWLNAMGNRIPAAIFGDWEEVSTFAGKSPAQLTDHMRALNEEKHLRIPGVVHGEYSRAGWLRTHILWNDFTKGLKWWLAHWIYPPPDFKDQAHSFSETDTMLPIDNDFTPYRDQIPLASVVGWQVSSQMNIIPRGYSDGDYFLDSFLDPIFNNAPVPPPVHEKGIVTIKYNPDDTELRVEEE